MISMIAKKNDKLNYSFYELLFSIVFSNNCFNYFFFINVIKTGK